MLWLRPKNAAAYCGVSERILRSWLKADLPFVKVGGVCLISCEAIDDWLVSHGSDTDPDLNKMVNDVLAGVL